MLFIRKAKINNSKQYFKLSYFETFVVKKRYVCRGWVFSMERAAAVYLSLTHYREGIITEYLCVPLKFQNLNFNK